MINYIITRFSILDYDTKAFQIVITNEKEEYNNKLFNEERLDHKFNVFEKVTYPSIIGQISQNYIWLIYTSKWLPDKYKTRLEKIINNNQKIKIIYIANFKELSEDIKKIKWIKPYSTIRLDDDDGLYNNFLSTINEYKNEDGLFISFPNGIKYKYENNKIIYGNKLFYKNNAHGLVAINRWVYSGNHNTISDRHKVKYIYTEDAYKVNCSEYCDTAREFS